MANLSRHGWGLGCRVVGPNQRKPIFLLDIARKNLAEAAYYYYDYYDYYDYDDYDDCCDY